MRLILQRVLRAAVRVDDSIVGEIGRGVVVLVGIERGDTNRVAQKAAAKLVNLRMFEDSEGRMTHAAASVGAAFLVVSQFTLAASLRKGRRPSFDPAAPPAEAEPLVELLVTELRSAGLPVATGVFGARMEVELVNDGPVTFLLEVSASDA